MTKAQESIATLLSRTEVRRPQVDDCTLDPRVRPILATMGPDAAMAHPPDATLEQLPLDSRRAYLYRNRPMAYLGQDRRTYLIAPIYALDRQRRFAPDDRYMYIDRLPHYPTDIMVFQLLELEHVIHPAANQNIRAKWSWLLESALTQHPNQSVLKFRTKTHFAEFFGVSRQCL